MTTLGAFVAASGQSWLLDLGATSHIIGSWSHFSFRVLSQSISFVKLANGSFSPVVGTDSIFTTFPLDNILFAFHLPFFYYL